jgi:hypothetical protein
VPQRRAAVIWSKSRYCIRLAFRAAAKAARLDSQNLERPADKREEEQGL